MKKITLIAAAALISASPLALADAETDAVMGALKKRYPATTFVSVDKTPFKGVYEVTMGKNIAYTDREGRYFLYGNLFDMQEQVDLTSAKRRALARVDWGKLNLADAIVTVKGRGERKLAVFTDPDCPYCRRLEPELDKLDNVTIYTFMLPLEQLHPEAKAKTIAVWCSADKAAAWKELMVRGVRPKGGNCDHPVDRIIETAAKLSIRGTPHLIAADGRSLPGAASASQIDAFLNGAKK